MEGWQWQGLPSVWEERQQIPVMGFGTTADSVTDPMFSWRMLCSVHSSPSLTQPLFCIGDLSWAFSLEHAATDDAGTWPRHQFLPHGHLKPLVLCVGNCNNPSDIFPPCFLSRTVLDGFLKHTSFLHLRKNTYISNLPCTIKADFFYTENISRAEISCVFMEI